MRRERTKLMHYREEMESIRQHPLPDWYDACKLGIFVHWGPYSVPAWAPPSAELGTVELDERWYANNPYAEWYLNSVRCGFGPTYEHHKNTYGADFAYEQFADQWKAERWDPDAWAALFREAGAGYVVLTTKHHDGFCLWDTALTDYNAVRRGPGQDLVARLTQSVQEAGMRMGLYYSGLIDWRYTSEPMLSAFAVDHSGNISYAYADYAYAQMMELIDRFHPSVLWNDIGWPFKGQADLPYLFAHYYNTVPDGLVNDRWGGSWRDFSTREYQFGQVEEGVKWEMTRGIGLSFGYNQIEEERHLIGCRDLVSLLVDTVARGGNLLLNVGPQADGTIPEAQADRLRYLGRWLEQNGDAIYGTQPTGRPKVELPTGEIFYTTQKNGDTYLLVDRLRTGDSVCTLPWEGEDGVYEGLTEGQAMACVTGGKMTLTLRDIPAEEPVLVLRKR